MYTYIVECSDKTLYTGWTTDIIQRLHTHNSGKGAKYTRGRLPVKLVYLKKFDTQSEAMQEESRIKKLSRAEKLSMIQDKRSDPYNFHEL